MASKLTSNDSPVPGYQSDVTSKTISDATTNHKNKINELVDEIAAAAIGTTNAETTAARPYNTNLKERLDQIWDGQYNFASSGGIVTINAGDTQKVDVTAFTGTIDGIQVDVSAATSATVAFTISDTRYDVVVANSDSTFTVVTGIADADPVLPAVAGTRKALWVLLVGTATVALSHDARDQGCRFNDEGKIAYGWKIQDAIDAITTGTIFIGKGKYYEEADLSGKSNIELVYENGAKHYRPTDTEYCIKCVNGSGTEENNIKITNGDFYGNSKTGAIELVKLSYTDKSFMSGCTFNGNATSTATYKNLLITFCDIFLHLDNLFLNSSDQQDFSTISVTNSTNYYQMVDFQYIDFGNKLTILNMTSPTMCALSSTRIAFFDAANSDLRTYDFDGHDWTQTGNDLNIATVGIPSICALLSTRIAFIDTTNDDLRTYDFDGTDWTQTGNDLNIATVGTPSICTLLATRIAFIDATNKDLRAYDFDGTDWTQTGNDLNIGGITVADMCSLSSTRIAFFDSGNKDLRAYNFDGADWTQTGSDLNLTSASLIKLSRITSSTIVGVDNGCNTLSVYVFDGAYWFLDRSIQVKTITTNFSSMAVTSINDTTVAFINGNATKLYAMKLTKIKNFLGTLPGNPPELP